MFMKDEANVKHLVKKKNDFGFNTKLNKERCGYEKAQIWLVNRQRR